MKEISQQLIGEILKMYKPEQRILLDASLQYPLMKGTFLIGPTYYTFFPFKHATDIEIQLCLNQLAYVGFAEIIRGGLLPNLRGLDFKALQSENMLIIESRKRFRKPIRTDIELNGEIILKKCREVGNLFLIYSDFQFENRSCFGSLELALIKP